MSSESKLVYVHDPNSNSPTVISHDIKLLQGPTGPQGSQGPMGPIGQPGLMGSRGMMGVMGPPGQIDRAIIVSLHDMMGDLRNELDKRQDEISELRKRMEYLEDTITLAPGGDEFHRIETDFQTLVDEQTDI